MNVVSFPSDESLVDFDIPLFDAGIDDDLVAEFKNEKIAVDDFAGGNLAWFAVPDDGGFLLGDKAHFVDGFFGADGVDDAD